MPSRTDTRAPQYTLPSWVVLMSTNTQTAGQWPQMIQITQSRKRNAARRHLLAMSYAMELPSTCGALQHGPSRLMLSAATLATTKITARC